MKVKAALVVVGLLAVVLVGCAPVVPGAEVSKGVVTFSAEGTAVATDDSELALEQAKVAAVVIAKANLLEKIRGAVIGQKASTADIQFQGQEAEAALRGFLSRATVEVKPTPETKVPPTSLKVTAVATLKLSVKEYQKKLGKYVE